MSYEEVIEIINEISARLGATATNLYPKLVKYGIVSNGIHAMMSLLGVLILGCVLEKCVGKILKDDDEDSAMICLLVSVFSAVGLTFAIVGAYYSIHDLVLWNTVPEIQAIDFILSYK